MAADTRALPALRGYPGGDPKEQAEHALHQRFVAAERALSDGWFKGLRSSPNASKFLDEMEALASKWK